MRVIDPAPIDDEAYGRFGSVVCGGAEAAARSANHGTAQAWDALATLESRRGSSARCSASLFRCAPHEGSRLEVTRLERHAHSTQMFVPMGVARYLVIVALGDDAPDLDTLSAFVVEGSIAITYAPGVWHHPMVALDHTIDFVNVIHCDGSADDCDERAVDEELIAIAVPPRSG